MTQSLLGVPVCGCALGRLAFEGGTPDLRSRPTERRRFTRRQDKGGFLLPKVLHPAGTQETRLMSGSGSASPGVLTQVPQLPMFVPQGRTHCKDRQDGFCLSDCLFLLGGPFGAMGVPTDRKGVLCWTAVEFTLKKLRCWGVSLSSALQLLQLTSLVRPVD